VERVACGLEFGSRKGIQIVTKVLVTGGAGFIGANLCRFLGQKHPNWTIRVIDNLSSGVASNLDGTGVDLIVASVLNESALNKAVEGADVVVHLAARPSVPRSVADPVTSHEMNATGTLRVLQAVRSLHNPFVVVASSSSVYGANPELPKSENMCPMPMSPYAVSKLATEQYALAWRYSYGIETLAFRFFNVFGPLQTAGHAYAAVIPAFLSAALNDEELPINGDGMQSRDFTYVGTVCAVIADAMERRVSCPSPVNLAFGSRISLLDVVAQLEAQLGQPLKRKHREARVGDVRHSQADNSLLKALFPDVAPVPFEVGLAETVEWMRSQPTQSV